MKTLYKKDFAINLSKESYGVLMFDLVCKKENNIGNLLNSSMLSNQIIAATKWLAQNMSDEVYLPVSFIGHKFAAMAIAIALERLQQVVKIESFISLDGRLDLIDKKDLLRILVPTMLVVHKNKIDIVDLNKNTAKTLPNSRVSLISSFQGFFETQINCDEVSKLSIEWLDNHYLKLDQAPIQQKSSILKEHAL